MDHRFHVERSGCQAANRLPLYRQRLGALQRADEERTARSLRSDDHWKSLPVSPLYSLGGLTMNRPSFLDRHPSLAVAFLFLLWLALGIAEGMGY